MFQFLSELFLPDKYSTRETDPESGREYVVGLIWDAVREQTLIQLIQKVILGPLKADLRAVGRPERNHQPWMRKGERGTRNPRLPPNT